MISVDTTTTDAIQPIQPEGGWTGREGGQAWPSPPGAVSGAMSGPVVQFTQQGDSTKGRIRIMQCRYLQPSLPLIAEGQGANESATHSFTRPSMARFSSLKKPTPFPDPAHPWRCSRALAMPLRSWRVVRSGARKGGFWFHVGCSRSSSVLDGRFMIVRLCLCVFV